MVCDRHTVPEVSVWDADGAAIVGRDVRWDGPGFASFYGRVGKLLGRAPEGDEHRIEALARVGDGTWTDRVRSLIRLDGYRIEQDLALEEWIEGELAGNRRSDLKIVANVARAMQQRVGEVLVEFLARLPLDPLGGNLCLAGGLFYNTFFTSLVAQSGLATRTFVPANPGNAGLAAGTALLAMRGHGPTSPELVSPFLGPGYDDRQVKAVLDNCKLTYSYVSDEEALVGQTVEALAKGLLVGWFQGRMEWGPRALGHRSILANPLAAYTLENLNVYLKRREPYRAYALSVRSEDSNTFFAGPAKSAFMEYDYLVRDPELFRHILPRGARTVRVQTVDDEPRLLRRLLEAFGAATGVPVLVNTSFNGFHEPIVCSPRDAIRVFYGTGLDVLVIGNFILRK